MTPIRRDREVESLKIAARWPGADRTTVVTLATRLAAAGADADGYAYFRQEAAAHPGDPLPLALTGFFQARLGTGTAAALETLDQAAAADLGLPQFFRGLALAGLPPDPARAKQAVADLEFVLAVREEFPLALLRAAHQALAAAYAVLGEDEQAAESARRSGLGSLDPGARLQYGGYWANPEDGFRFTSPRIWRPEPDIRVAQGYDFGDFAFISTADGIIAIDAGTTPGRVTAALADAGLPAGLPVSHLILTHAHFDHVGGVPALRGPGTEVLTAATFPAGLKAQRLNTVPFGYFLGEGGGAIPEIVPDRVISEPTSIVAGGTELVLYPTPGGETSDALMIYLPASRTLFTGDVMMPYLGAPFFAEGSPDGLLETLAFIRDLQPAALIQGHTTLTETFTVAALPGLQAALGQLRDEAEDAIARGSGLAGFLDGQQLPEVLRDHPQAVVPYLVIRDNFAARLFRQRTGYWGPGRDGMEPVTGEQRAAALDLLGGGREDAFAAAARVLTGQGDHALALDIIEPGLLRYPGSAELAGLRRTALHGLMERTQQFDPFRFLIYAELAGAELGPVG